MGRGKIGRAAGEGKKLDDRAVAPIDGEGKAVVVGNADISGEGGGAVFENKGIDGDIAQDGRRGLRQNAGGEGEQNEKGYRPGRQPKSFRVKIHNPGESNVQIPGSKFKLEVI